MGDDVDLEGPGFLLILDPGGSIFVILVDVSRLAWVQIARLVR